MNKKLILKDYEKKIKLLEKYNRSYFNENKSLITDANYDILKSEIR